MSNTDKTNFNKLVSLPISLVILLVLSFQALADLKKACPEAQSWCSRLGSDPYFYPFLTYPMYSRRYYEGDKIEQYVLLGLLSDSSQVTILPEDLGMGFWLFQKNVIKAVIENDSEQIAQFVEQYQNTHNKTLTGLQLENHPLVLSRDSVSPGEPTVLKSIRLNALEKE
ncbi:MAG: hypothetical protein ACFB4I_15580 [Cyanophyceae cyanobacterium]